ncbi:MAG: hypothetical protein AAF710_08005 [Planctomycetota bacterium]
MACYLGIRCGGSRVERDRFVRRAAVLGVGLVFIAAAGCSVNREQPLSETRAVATETYPEVFEHTVRLLRSRGFVVDRQDFRFGVITTRPAGSPTLFEPWRIDNRTAELAARSTLGDLRRRVEVSFAAADPAGYQLDVAVRLERLQVPQRRLNGVANGSVFGDLSHPPRDLGETETDGPFWRPIGRDTALEAELARLILDRG